MGRRMKAQRGEGFRPHPEPGADGDGLGINESTVSQFDAGEAPLAYDDPLHLPVEHLDSGGLQELDLPTVDFGLAVEHHGEAGSELPEQPHGVQAGGVGDDVHDVAVANLETVA